MTRKDYQLIADFIKSWVPRSGQKPAALAMASKLKQRYPKFNTQKFLEACNAL
jgi:hypothetical protein